MASNVLISVRMNTADAVRNAGALARAVNRSMTSIAADTRLATVATREFTRAQIGMSDAGLIAARNSAAVGRALLAQEAATQRMIIAERAYTAEIARQIALRASMPVAPLTPPPAIVPVGRGGAGIGSIGSGLRSVGGALTSSVTYPVLASAALAVSASVSRESSFGNIEKLYSKSTNTEEGKRIAQDLKELNVQMVQLTHEIPVTYKQLASFGEVGGQLGVPIKALAEFEKVAAQLGITTDLSGEQAATGLAKIAAATGVADKDFSEFVKRAGSSLSVMSSEGAASTSQILDMTMRFASAGKTAKMTVPDMFALANAVASMGQEAEAGGGAMMQLLGKLGTATARGGTSLTQFATTAHMTNAEFKALFQKDGFAAIMAYVEGLARLEKGGRSSIDTLSKMGITNIRLRQSVLNLATGFEQAAKLRGDAIEGWQQMTALEDRTGIVASKTGSKLMMLWSEVEETAKAFGDDLVPTLRDLLPALEDLLKHAGDLAKSFAGMPRPLQEVIIGCLALGAALGPMLSGLGGIFAVASSAKRGLDALALANAAAIASGTTMAARGAAALAVGAPYVAAIIAATGFVVTLGKKWGEVESAQDDARSSAERYADTLAHMKAAGGSQALTAVNNDLIREINQLQEALDETMKQPQGANIDSFIRTKLAGEGFDPKVSPFINNVMAVRARIASDQADLQKVKTLQHEQVISGAGEAKRAADTAGVSDLAKSVVSHAFDSINTPQNVASCALFLSEIYKRAGAQVPAGGIASAKGLMDWAVKQGATAHPTSQALPGDLIVWHGNRYGASQKGGGRSGYHVGLSLGDGKIRQSSDGVVKTMSLYDAAHAQAFTIPTAGGRGASGLGNQPFDASAIDDPKGKQAKDAAQARVEAAGLDVAKAQLAVERCDAEYNRTKDPYFLLLKRTALVKLQAARMDEAQKTLDKALKEAKDGGITGEAAKGTFAASKFKIDTDFTTATQQLDDQIKGTPAERRKRENDYLISQKQRDITGTSRSIRNYEKWFDKGDVRQAPHLKDAYAALKKLQDELANTQYNAAVDDNPLPDKAQEAKRKTILANERDQSKGSALDDYNAKIDQFNDKMKALNAADHQGAKDRLQTDRQLLDTKLQAAKTDEEKLALGQQILKNTTDQLKEQFAIDKLSPDKNTKTNAEHNFSIGLQVAGRDTKFSETNISDDASQRRIAFLRAEADVTDDLIAKKAMLIEIHTKEIALAVASGDKDAKTAATNRAKREDISNEREMQFRNADQSLKGLLIDRQGNPEAVLKQFTDIIPLGALDQQREALSRSLDVLTAMIQAHVISRKEALADLASIQSRYGPVMTSDQAQQVKETTNQTKGLIAVGGRAFWSEMTKSAADNSGGFLTALLTGHGAKNAIKGFFTSMASMAEQGLSGAVSGTIQNAIMGGSLFGHKHLKDAAAIAPASTAAITATTVATDSAAATTNAAGNVITTAASTVKQLPKATKESRMDMYQGAARIAAAAAALSVAMNPKKAKKASAWGLAGAVVGGIIGAYAGDWAAGAQLGAGFGSMLGSAFADGGAPPVGKISLGGERGPEPFVTANGRVSWLGLKGPELFMPKVPGVVIPNHMLPRAPSMAFAGGVQTPRVPSGGMAGEILRQLSEAGGGDIHAQQNFYGPVSRTLDLENANRSFGKMLGTLRRNGGRPGSG